VKTKSQAFNSFTPRYHWP